MLHEILLALSGHRSPIFDSGADGIPLLAPAEKSLLHRLDHIATLHRDIRGQCQTILKYHKSMVCKTTANGIIQTQLGQFQQLILRVEEQAITRDAMRVGAYNILPLASICNDFEPWCRRLEWLWDAVSFVAPASSDGSALAETSACHGAALLDRIRRDSKTGYPDIQQAALTLLALAEKAWLRQLMQYFLKPGSVGDAAIDLFLVQHQDRRDETATGLSIDSTKLPIFVTHEAASSILFIGKTLKYLTTADEETMSISSTHQRLPIMEVAKQFQPLAQLQSPIASSSFSSAVSKVRAALSQRIAGGLLPIRQIVRTVTLLRQFFLVGRPAFVDALITEADKLLLSRRSRIKNTPLRLGSSLAGVMMKEGEINSVLSKAFISLSPYINKDESVDNDLEWAREHLRMTIATPSSSGQERPPVEAKSLKPFHDFLLSTPARLDLSLEAPLDLFLSARDVETYSAIHSYVLSIQRGRSHVADLWHLTAARKDHPAPVGPPRSNRPGTMRVLNANREKAYERMRAMRTTWTTASSVVFLLTELGNYLVAEVIGSSWDAFSLWINGNAKGREKNVEDRLAASTSSLSLQPTEGLPQDPELLSEAHRLYLKSLVQALLLTEGDYLQVLHSLLKQVEHFVAVISRLLHVQHNLDLQAEGVVYGGTHNYEEEEHEVYEEVLGAGEAVGSDAKRLTVELQKIDAARAERGPAGDTLFQEASTGFEPWKGYGVDRLLLRLDVSDEQRLAT